jgi:hypothetical protein
MMTDRQLASSHTPTTPTDEQIAEFERLIHVACAKRRAAKESACGNVPSSEADREFHDAIAAVNAHRANLFEGETL